MRRPKQPRISNSAVLLMPVKTAKSEAILRRTNIKPKQGRQPLPVYAGSVITILLYIVYNLRCTVAYWFCAFQEFVQGRAPLKGAMCGRRTRKIPLSQGFSSCITVHRTVIQFTFFGAPFGMGVSRSAERADGLCPSTPQAAGAPLEHALFLSSRRLWTCARRCFRGFY